MRAFNSNIEGQEKSFRKPQMLEKVANLVLG